MSPRRRCYEVYLSVILYLNMTNSSKCWISTGSSMLSVNCLLWATNLHWILFTDDHLNVCVALFNSRVLDPGSSENRVG